MIFFAVLIGWGALLVSIPPPEACAVVGVFTIWALIVREQMPHRRQLRCEVIGWKPEKNDGPQIRVERF